MRRPLISVLYILKGVRCKGCGATVGLARDWIGLAWRDERGRHYCEKAA